MYICVIVCVCVYVYVCADVCLCVIQVVMYTHMLKPQLLWANYNQLAEAVYI